MNNKNVIGANIRNLRRQRGMTQAVLADNVGVNRLTISRYEKGVLRPSEKALNKIAWALDVKPIELMYDFEMDYESTAAIDRFITDLEVWKLMVGSGARDESGKIRIGVPNRKRDGRIQLKLSEDELNHVVELTHDYYYFLLQQYEEKDGE